MVPPGSDEMVVDLFRQGGGDSGEPKVNPMARFDDGWETSYVSDYQKDDRAANGMTAGGKVRLSKAVKNEMMSFQLLAVLLTY